jgi:hypothetical protein
MNYQNLPSSVSLCVSPSCYFRYGVANLLTVLSTLTLAMRTYLVYSYTATPAATTSPRQIQFLYNRPTSTTRFSDIVIVDRRQQRTQMVFVRLELNPETQRETTNELRHRFRENRFYLQGSRPC